MTRALLIQLPVPQPIFGRQTGNVPLAGGWLALAGRSVPGAHVDILPEETVSYLADAVLIDGILARKPDIVGFSVYSWNLDRSLHLAAELKKKAAVRIVFGGPEITPDNRRLDGASVDFLVYGEGESVFTSLLSDAAYWDRGRDTGGVGRFFESSPNPYTAGLVAPGPGNLMLLETQRGCPYRCGYCFYSKARRAMAVCPESIVLDAVDWALDRRIAEVYLLDPCLSSRPGLRPFLGALAARNRHREISFISEIRAETVTEALADLFQAAGFAWFEIGLQSTNPAALEVMNRHTDINRFVHGARLLKDRGIRPYIDLILGLPGDDLPAFKASVDFLVDHGLGDDVHLFPLSLLPGTDFRRQSRSMGMVYTPAPPYTVLKTPTFSEDEMLHALEYAERQLDAAFYPFPDLSIAWRSKRARQGGDVRARIGDRLVCVKLFLTGPRSQSEIQALARNLGYPYQIFVARRFSDPSALCRMLEMLSRANPFTPLEIVFLAPERPPDRTALLSAIRLRRPHYLDLEERFLFEKRGNRSVVFTMVCKEPALLFDGEMQRQVFWWDKAALPSRRELQDLSCLDGVLIDVPLPEEQQVRWQDDMAAEVDDLPAVSFSDLALQKRWLLKTADGQWAANVLHAMSG